MAETTNQKKKPKNALAQMVNLASAGLCSQSLYDTGSILWELPPDELHKLFVEMKKHFATDGSKLDILAEMTLNYRRQNYALDMMCRQLKKENQSASFFATYGRMLKETNAMLLTISEQRDKENRNMSKAVEKADQEFKDEQRSIHREMERAETYRQLGYFFSPTMGVVTPYNDLTPEQRAIRDIVRMRMLPKSPREDYLILEAMGLLSEHEKVENADWINDIEIKNCLDDYDANHFDMPNPSYHKEYDLLARRIFLERLKYYNETWQKAEEQVEGLMKKFNVKLGQPHTFRGLPPEIRAASEGDEAAIQRLREMVNADDVAPGHDDLAPGHSGRGDAGEAPQPTTPKAPPKTRDDVFVVPTKIIGAVTALFLAFSSLWVSLCLIIGPST